MLHLLYNIYNKLFYGMCNILHFSILIFNSNSASFYKKNGLMMM